MPMRVKQCNMSDMRTEYKNRQPAIIHESGQMGVSWGEDRLRGISSSGRATGIPKRANEIRMCASSAISI